MGKSTLIKIGIGAAIIGAAFLTGGASILPSIAATSSTVAGATIATAAIGTALSTTAIGAMALAAGASIALSGVGQAFAKAPSVSLSQIDRLNASLVPSAPRKMVFGETAMATDIRYVEPSGENQEYIDYIIAVASHAVEGVDQLWFEDTNAWTRTGGVGPKYAGYLTVSVVTEGSAANTIAINGGGKWGSSRRLTGCAYIHLRIKRTGNGKKAESPFSGGLPSRLTIIGRGAKLYDPRRDSTVPGGSGPMRADDQSTWRYQTDDGASIGENLTLQALWFLLGWRINGKLAVGRGLPPARLDLAGWIEAANLGDEQVRLAAGGTQPRYVGAGVASEGDDPGSVLQTFAVGCNGRFRDGGGKLSLSVMHNDLAAAAADDGLGDDDVLSPFTWNPDPALEQTYNIVRGRFTDPSAASLYQLVDYPEVSLPSPDGIDRVLTLDLPMIEDAARAQRIARQVLQRKQYDRTFTATFGARAWAYQVGDVLPFTFSPLGFDRALFRVAEQQPTMDGTCPMVLTVEHPQIYAWDRDDSAAVVAADPVRYDPLNNAVILGVAQAGTTAEWPLILDSDPVHRPRPEDGATVGAPAGTLVAGRPAQAVVDSLDVTLGNLLTEMLRNATFRGETDEVLIQPDGSTLRRVVEVLSVNQADLLTFATSLREVDSNGDGRAVNTIRNMGPGIDVVTGTVNTLTGGRSAYYVFADEFGLVQKIDGRLVKPFVVTDGVAYFDHVKVRLLDVDVVKTPNILRGAVSLHAQATSAQALAGEGAAPTTAMRTVVSYSFTLAYPAHVSFTIDASMDYTQPGDFGFHAVVDGTGTYANGAGGSGFAATSFARSATVSLPAGAHVIAFQWRGSAGVRLLPGARLGVEIFYA